ncbi:hypothetical protein P3T76_006862 [Phytophthora citrophthora]|uniref:Uncharacterized protein n=1 Tax=Phytophthora citrophthora TaxID=4793 RepID=A0AAD9LLW0_9STRA|nr:hypothetical protein P3T76_006862 [Phytophthora citrophthora]
MKIKNAAGYYSRIISSELYEFIDQRIRWSNSANTKLVSSISRSKTSSQKFPARTHNYISSHPLRNQSHDHLNAQTGQRWQLRIIKGDAITFETVGLQASVEVIDDLATLPGKFSSSNAKYDEIWTLGARAVTAACLDAGSQVPSWSSSEENGTFVPSTRPGISYRTWNLTDYVLTFQSQITRGGAGYTIAYDLPGNRDVPERYNFSNINTTLFHVNTATLAYGYNFSNSTSVTSYILGQYNVPFSVKENIWYPIEIRVNSTAGNIVFSVDGQQVFDIALTEMGFTDSQLSFYDYASRGDGAIGSGFLRAERDCT